MMPKEGGGLTGHLSINFQEPPSFSSLYINIFTGAPDRVKINYQAPLITEQGNEGLVSPFLLSEGSNTFTSGIVLTPKEAGFMLSL